MCCNKLRLGFSLTEVPPSFDADNGSLSDDNGTKSELNRCWRLELLTERDEGGTGGGEWRTTRTGDGVSIALT